MEFEFSLFTLILFSIAFFAIIYFIVRLAVENGINQSSKQINGLQIQLEQLQQQNENLS